MRIFITGGTGFIGSAVVKELLGAGHKVVGLARSEKSAAALRNVGAEIISGSLENLDTLRKGANEADGVIHLGFNNDFSNFAKSCEADKIAIETIGETLAGTNKPLVVTAGVAGVHTGNILTEDYSPGAIAEKVSPRKSERTALSFVSKGVSVSVVRLPPSVHGEGRAGFVSILIETARKTGVSAYLGKGQNRWSAVHHRDAARVFALALEKGAASAVYHAVSDTGVAVKDIAEVIGQKLDIPVTSKSQLAALTHFGAFFGMTAALDCPAASEITQNALGWKSQQLGLLEDLESEIYWRTEQ
jgi:nucleoside-diphosphate-sugar epimerase